MLHILSDKYFMEEALREAAKAAVEGEVPVGAVIVSQGRIIARAHNLTEKLRDVTAHAEMLALTAASDYLNSKYLENCTLFVSLEPCVMCAGALHHAHVERIVWAANDEKRGFERFGRELLHPKTQVEKGLMAEESSAMLKKFFNERR